MNCGTCGQFRAHKLRAGIGVCKLMQPRRVGAEQQPAIISADQRCYFSIIRWTKKEIA